MQELECDHRAIVVLLRALGGGDHGSGLERAYWFGRGFNAYDMDVCDQTY